MSTEKKISDMSPEECLDALTFSQIRELLYSAKSKRNAFIKAWGRIFDALDDMCIDSSFPSSGSEYRLTLEQAIYHYVHYGEHSVEEIMKDIKAAYKEVE